MWQQAERQGKREPVPKATGEDDFVKEAWKEADNPTYGGQKDKETTHKVVDLPKEYKNEKQIVEVPKPKKTPANTKQPKATADVPQGNANVAQENASEAKENNKAQENASVAQETETDGNKEQAKATEGQETDKSKEDEEAVQEARELAQDDLDGIVLSKKNWDKWSDKQKQEVLKTFLDKKAKERAEQSAKAEGEKSPKSLEDVMQEARAIAQDDLEGFEITPELWESWSPAQREMAIKNYLAKKQKVDMTHNETNNYDAYERYPTALRVAEDVVGTAGDAIGGVKNLATSDLGGASINDAVNRADIPHYTPQMLYR